MKNIIIVILGILLLGCFRAQGQDPVFRISEIKSISATCSAFNGAIPASKKTDGSIQIYWIGGNASFKLSLFDGDGKLLQTHNNLSQNSDQFTGLNSGDYSIKIEDLINGKSLDTSYTLTSKWEVILSAIPYPVNCKGETNGKIRLEVNSTTKFVTFEVAGIEPILTSDTNTTFTDLKGGTYKAKVTNSDGCIDSMRRVLVYEPKALTITDSVVHVSKYGDSTGQIFVTITGGASPYNFSFSDNNNLKLDSGKTPSRIHKERLFAGIYDFNIADANNCRIFLNDVLVKQPEALKLQCQIKQVSCYGMHDASIHLSATGGLGKYSFGIKDTSLLDSIYTNLKPRIKPYIVFVKDSAGTEQTQEIFIVQPAALQASIAKIYQLKCFNDASGAAKLNISGGTYPYFISKDSTLWLQTDSLNNLSANSNFKIFIKDQNNCHSSLRLTVTQPQKLKLQLDSMVRPVCLTKDGEIYTSATGGTINYSFQWLYVDSSKTIDNPISYLKNIYPGHYTVKVTDANSCSDTIQVLVSNINDQHFDSILVKNPSCFNGNDGAIEIFVSGGQPQYQYFLNTNIAQKMITGLKAGNFIIKTIDGQGCGIISKVLLTQPKEITIKSDITQPTCSKSNDGSINIEVNGGTMPYSFKWSNNFQTQNINTITKGSYEVNITDAQNCMFSKTFELVAPNEPTAAWKDKKLRICTGNSITLDGGNFLKYQWFKNSVLLDTMHKSLIIDQAGTYSLLMTDKNGCNGSDTFILEVAEHPLEAVLLLPDSAFVGEISRAIDVTWPAPDSIQWYYSQPVKIDSTNSWSESFAASSTGLINITLRAYSGGCFSDSSKTIMIVDSAKIIAGKVSDEMLYIKEFTLFPNPNNGEFNADIALNKKANIRLSLYSISETKLKDQKSFEGQNLYVVKYNYSSLKPGVYLLILESENNKQVKKFIKTK